MRKHIAMILALGLLTCGMTACGTATESSIEPATEAVTEEETTEVVYIKDETIIGKYVCDRATLDVTSNDAEHFLFTIIWGSSYNETAEWDGIGQLDQNHVLHYEGCREQYVTYDENGEGTADIKYSDGTGTLVFTEAGVEWHDDKEDAGKGMLFTPAPAEEETVEETTEEPTEETTAAEEETTEAAAEEETNPPLVGIFEGTYAEKNAGRGVITITNNMDDTYTVNIHWSSSAAECADWKFSGSFNGRQVLEYDNCEMTHTVYAEDGNPTVDEEGHQTPFIVYTDGTGYLKLTDEGLFWNDEKDHVADDAVFIKQ